MKNIKSLLVILLSLLLLVGCGNKSTSITNKNDVLMKIGKTTVTKGDLYSQLVNYDGADMIIKNALKQICNIEVETTDEIIASANETMEEIKEHYGDIETALSTLGYSDEDEFYEDVLASAKVNALVREYIEDNFDELAKKYNPLKIKIMSFTSEDYVNESAAAYEELKNGASFDEVAQKYMEKEVNEQLYTTLSEADANVVTYLASVTTPGTSSVIASTTNKASYIVQVTNNNVMQLKEDFIGELEYDEDFTEEVYVHYFKLHNFRIYDIDVYNLVKEKYPNYLVQDAD